MAKKIQYRRLLMLALLLSAAFVGLGYRLVDLQVLRHESLSALAQQNTFSEVVLESRRGDILDARGNVLASSTFVKTICADPTLMGGHQVEVARVLAPLLQLDENWLAEKMRSQLVQNEKGEQKPRQYVPLKKKVPLETWQKIQRAMSELQFVQDEKKLSRKEQAFYVVLREKAIFADSQDDQLRVYPNGVLAAHVLGYVLNEDRITNNHHNVELIGKEGIEGSFDSKLRGTRGWRVTETDRRKRELVNMREQSVEARDGLNVVLTLDSVIQHIVENALSDAMEKYSPASVSGIVIRPRTGEVLAMASLPTYDPGNLSTSAPETRRNRVISDYAEPGSTFKIVVVSGALNDHTVRPTDTFDCEHGRFFYAGRMLRDHESYGVLSVEGIITKSSNIGAAKIGIRMGETRLYDYMRDFGFGQRTLIPLPAEISGLVHPVKAWSKVSIAQIPMGHGVAVTRLQMVMAMCAIANRGALMRPMLVDRLEDQDHAVVAQYTPQRVRQVISESAARQMVTALKTVVSTNGTAKDAMMDHYTVAGKTGTAQKPIPGGYSTDKFFSSFIGFFPADNPELCISITLDEPKGGHFGGKIGAPIFKQIAERAANYLNIRPEDGTDVPTMTDPVSAAIEKAALKTSMRSQ